MRSRSWSSIAFHDGVGPSGPCVGAVHWPSALPRSMSVRSASASLVTCWSVTPRIIAFFAGPDDRDRGVASERAACQHVDVNARPSLRVGEPTDAATAHDARGEPHQADYYPQRDEQAREQRSVAAVDIRPRQWTPRRRSSRCGFRTLHRSRLLHHAAISVPLTRTSTGEPAGGRAR